MAKVKTLKGLSGKLKAVLKTDFESLKGYNELSQSAKNELSLIRGDLYNAIGKIEQMTNKP